MRAALVLLMVALAACGGGATEAVVPVVQPPAPKPLVAGVHVLAGIDPALPTTDLLPFRDIVGDATVVALGESTHTSAGYYRAKFRLIRYMVEQLGFRVVMLESPWLQALPATQYVASCSGTPEQAIGSLNGVWRGQDVLDRLRWLCEWNQQHPSDRVSFIGFDIQEPWASEKALSGFIERVDKSQRIKLEPLRQCLGARYASEAAWFASPEFTAWRAGNVDASASSTCLSGITSFESWISANAVALASASSATAVEEARITLIALRAWQLQLAVPDPGGYQARDFGMATLIQRLHALHAPGKKAVVWAWNWHIARRYEDVRGFDDEPQRLVPRQGARAMGSFLSDALGDRYLPIALVGYEVEMVTGIDLPVQSNPASVEQKLHEFGKDYLLVDLRQPVSFLTPGTTYKISQEWGDPYRQFSALLYLERSPGMGILR